MATKKRRLNPFMEFMAKFRLENKGKGWSVVEMAKEGGKEWRGRNGTVRKGKKTRGGDLTEMLMGAAKKQLETTAKGVAVKAQNAFTTGASDGASTGASDGASTGASGGRRHRKRRGGFAEYNTGGKRRTKSRRR